MDSVPPFLAGGLTATDIETVLAICRLTEMANGAKELP
jgi:hypothetical protein